MCVLSFKQICIIHDNTQKYSQIFTYSSYKTVVTWISNVFLQGECWKDRHWCCNCPGFLWVPSIEGIHCGHCLVAHILQIDLCLVLRWQSLVSQTTHCERPVSLVHVFNQQRPLALHFFKTKKIFHCRTRFVGTGFHENALSTNKESFYYYLYVAHTCVQPENAISPAVWPTNIFLSISLCVSPSSKQSMISSVSVSHFKTRSCIHEGDH